MKYRLILLLLVPFIITMVIANTGCGNPYRRGTTVKPVGGTGGAKYHTRPASAKAYKKRKY